VLERVVIGPRQAEVVLVIDVIVMAAVLVSVVVVVRVRHARFVRQGRVRVIVVAVLVGVDDRLPARDGRRRDEGGQDGRDDGRTEAQDVGSLPHRVRARQGSRMSPLDQVPCGMPVAQGLPASGFRATARPVGGQGGNLASSVNFSSASESGVPRASGACEAGERFEEVRRTEALTRLRQASFLLLPPLTLALAVNVRVFGDSLPLRALALIGMLGLAALTHVIVGQRFAGRRAIPIAVAFVLALGLLLIGTTLEVPGGRDVHVGTISALMMGAAIIIPWGVWPQIGVAALLALAYGFVPSEAAVTAHPVDLVMSLADCVALSAVGAYMLDRQRRQAFREREQARRVTAEREILLAAARQLNQSLDFDETVATITRVGRTIIGADTVALIMIESRRTVLRTVSVAGELLDIDREVLNLEVPLVALEPLLAELRTEGFAVTPGPRLQALTDLAREQFGVRATLFVAIERQGELLGYVTFNYRRETAAFTEEQIHLARGFAAQCAIALANANLVTDLNQASRVKSEFVSTMSHELRTPLSVILGYTDVLQDAVKDIEARVVLDRIRVAGRELLELVQTTLDLNRLESGQDPAHCETVGMQELWDELAGQYAALDRGAGVGLRWEVAGSPTAFTDRRKLKIIVKNLVNNALKFTAVGEVCVSVRATGERCIVVVRDTGIGIPAEHLGGVFDMFRQVDASDRRAHGGVGLGLYIVRKLAEQLHATLDVRSTVGVGTTFTLTLPRQDAITAAAA
jgi:signal transduction histidine kinase